MYPQAAPAMMDPWVTVYLHSAKAGEPLVQEGGADGSFLLGASFHLPALTPSEILRKAYQQEGSGYSDPTDRRHRYTDDQCYRHCRSQAQSYRYPIRHLLSVRWQDSLVPGWRTVMSERDAFVSSCELYYLVDSYRMSAGPFRYPLLQACLSMSMVRMRSMVSGRTCLVRRRSITLRYDWHLSQR